MNAAAQLFRLAYLAELFLWLPLLLFVATMPSTRRWLTAPLVASALAAAYEGYMTWVWEPKVVNPIRLDIFLVLAVTGVANAVTGLALLGAARGHPHRMRLLGAAMPCLAVPALALVGYVGIRADTEAVGTRLDDGRRFRFEAALRDEATQKRVFGNLDPGANPWAGYYRGDGRDERFAHLIVNDEGRFWLYHAQLYEYPGSGTQSATSADTFEGRASGRLHERMRLALRRESADAYSLSVDFGSGPGKATLRKAAPPRFARPPATNAEVRFDGVYSAAYDEGEKHFWLVQVWLWESGGEWWGRYLRDYYERGQLRDFIHPEAVQPACGSSCDALSFKSGRGPVTLTRLNADEWRAKLAGVSQEVTLRRGETLPGFLLDQAPLATRRQNREWLEAVMTGHMRSWQVPQR